MTKNLEKIRDAYDKLKAENDRLKPLVEVLKKCHGAMGYAFDDHADRYYISVQDMINEALKKAGVDD